MLFTSFFVSSFKLQQPPESRIVLALVNVCCAKSSCLIHCCRSPSVSGRPETNMTASALKAFVIELIDLEHLVLRVCICDFHCSSKVRFFAAAALRACAWNRRLLLRQRGGCAQECDEAKTHEDAVLDWWKRTNGLHTQESWVTNYRAHAGPWPALLSIHGVRPDCYAGSVSGIYFGIRYRVSPAYSSCQGITSITSSAKVTRYSGAGSRVTPS